MMSRSSRSKPELKRSYHKRRGRAELVTTVGFIRVRRRKLKPKYRWYTPPTGRYAGISRKVEIPDSSVESVSYDLVRAVRINGEPRHKFVLGFGSPVSRWWGNSTIHFWARVFRRMARHGFSKDQQFQIAEKLKRKGIPLPTVKECKAGKARAIEWNEAYPDFDSPPERFDVLIAFIRRGRRRSANAAQARR
jgi:hypothetical protein